MQGTVPLIADKPGHTRVTNLVAALLTIGCPIVPTPSKRCIDDLSGKEETTFHMGMAFQMPGREEVQFTLGSTVVKLGATISTITLLNAYEDGKLEQYDPTHPFLDCIRGLKHSHDILDWIKLGRPCHLAWAASRQRMSYVPGAQRVPEGVKLDAAALTGTRSLAEAAALGVVGIPVVDIQGIDNHHTFIVPRRGFTLCRGGDQHGCYDAVELMTGLRDGSLMRDEPEHPFLYAYHARKQREALLKHLDQEIPLILFRRKDSPRSAQLNGNAADAAFEQAEDHLEGG